jgi:hypothetical protein
MNDPVVLRQRRGVRVRLKDTRSTKTRETADLANEEGAGRVQHVVRAIDDLVKTALVEEVGLWVEQCGGQGVRYAGGPALAQLNCGRRPREQKRPGRESTSTLNVCAKEGWRTGVMAQREETQSRQSESTL